MNLGAVEGALEQGAMSLTTLFRKATNLLFSGGDGPLRPPPLDGEIIYCKNNVCVHPPANLNKSCNDHFPGYLNIRSQDDDVLGSTLILTWIPNSTLKKNPRSIENSPAQTRITPRRSPRQDYSRVDFPSPYTESPGSADGVSLHISDTHLEPVRESSVDTGNTEYIVEELNLNSPKEDEASLETRNNEKPDTLSTNGMKSRVGINVNPLREKITNVISNGIGPKSVSSSISEVSSDSSSRPADSDVPRRTAPRHEHPQLAALRSRSGSSNKSVASIEMDGDNLVVVTEEVLEDEAFTDVQSSSDVKPVESFDIIRSPPPEQFRQTLDKLAAAASKSVINQQTDSQRLRNSLDLRLNLNSGESAIEEKVSDFDFEIPAGSRMMAPGRKSSSSSTSGPDSTPPSPSVFPSVPCTNNVWSPDECKNLCDETNSYVRHHMSFPENAVDFTATTPDSASSDRTAAEQVCGVFSVDLGQMRSLRIFYSDDACTSGQLVIASRESQYKILHFHHGGLDRLAETFADWKFLAQPKHKMGDSDTHCRQFSVIRPYLTNDQCHPEDGALEMVNEDTWRRHMNDCGQIEDDFHLRKAIFFAGLDASLRHEIWPFLLHYFPYMSTFEEREHMRNDRFIDYQNIRKARESMSTEEKESFWRLVQCTVEKDVVRTDRCHPYFRGEGNPNIEILKNILLNYAVAHPLYGYTQGMSDLLAPVLTEIQNEVDAYWCFVGLMQKTTFFSSPTDVDMDSQLTYLRELLRVLLPHFYQHLEKVQDGLELLFCHRWLLLCFKREFVESDALRLWEACWARYQTDYFHLFVCAAVIAVYGEDVVQQDLPADEMLLHFSSLSMHMSGEVVLRKARGLLHKFRTLRRIPCTLDGLCTKCGPGMWDSGHVPAIECTGSHEDGVCPSAANK